MMSQAAAGEAPERGPVRRSDKDLKGYLERDADIVTVANTPVSLDDIGARTERYRKELCVGCTK